MKTLPRSAPARALLFSKQRFLHLAASRILPLASGRLRAVVASRVLLPSTSVAFVMALSLAALILLLSRAGVHGLIPAVYAQSDAAQTNTAQTNAPLPVRRCHSGTFRPE